MNRRGFFAGVLGLTVAKPAAAHWPDAPFSYRAEYGGWTIHWREYMPVVFQDALFGFWLAATPASRVVLVSTCYGVLGQCAEGDEIDATRAPGWPLFTSRTDPAELESAKIMSHLRLLRFIGANDQSLSLTKLELMKDSTGKFAREFNTNLGTYDEWREFYPRYMGRPR